MWEPCISAVKGRGHDSVKRKPPSVYNRLQTCYGHSMLCIGSFWFCKKKQYFMGPDQCFFFWKLINLFFGHFDPVGTYLDN